MIWSTGNVALHRYLMSAINSKSLIQIGGLAKGQCVMRAEASSAHSCHGALALPSVFTATEATLPYHYLELDTSVGDVSLSTEGNLCLNEGEVKACAQVSVDAGDSSE